MSRETVRQKSASPIRIGSVRISARSTSCLVSPILTVRLRKVVLCSGPCVLFRSKPAKQILFALQALDSFADVSADVMQGEWSWGRGSTVRVGGGTVVMRSDQDTLPAAGGAALASAMAAGKTTGSGERPRVPIHTEIQCLCECEQKRSDGRS